METIIAPIERELIKSELTAEKFLRPTNKANNDIYVITAHNSPNVMLEIGRLRELSFRDGGGGTGKSSDTDEYDYMDKPYRQLIVWDHDNEEIVGGYRFLPGADVELAENGQPKFVMSHLFRFNDDFIQNYMSSTIELGRAFVQPKYQTTEMGMKSLFALDNLWDGLGALIHSVKGAKYFIGKVTIYKDYPLEARELLYTYLHKYFGVLEGLIQPKNKVKISENAWKKAIEVFTGTDVENDYKHLQKELRNMGTAVPPMFNAYIGLSDTMKIFGSIVDPDFGHVYETGMMVTMDDLHETKKKRYIEPYLEYLRKLVQEKRAEKILQKAEKGSRRTTRKKS